jgi:hypothetical protein
MLLEYASCPYVHEIATPFSIPTIKCNDGILVKKRTQQTDVFNLKSAVYVSEVKSTFEFIQHLGAGLLRVLINLLTAHAMEC